MGAESIHRLNRLYFGQYATEQRDSILEAISKRKPVPGVYLITFASNGVDQLDVLPLYMACFQMHKDRLPTIAGVGLGRAEAFETVRRIVEDAYRETGNCRLQEFLLARDAEGAGT